MNMKYIFCTSTIWCIFSLFSLASSPGHEGAKAYNQQNYVESVEFFSKAIKESPSAENYYNLGNANYRLKQYPQAVISYLRALHINPSYEQAQYNLRLTQQKIAPGTPTIETMPWETPFTLLLNWGSVKNWTTLSFICLILAFVGWTLFRIFSRNTLQKVSLFYTLVFSLGFCFSSICAVVQRYRYNHNKLAVVMSEQAQGYTSPTPSAKKENILSSGSIVYIQDAGTKGWARVQTADGSETWIQTTFIEPIAEKD